MKFNAYWNAKAQKKRKSWPARTKRYAEAHLQLEEIRKEVYLPLDYGLNFTYDNYMVTHFVGCNPIVSWQNCFKFSEDGIRNALDTEDADLSSFRMSVSKESIEGKEAPKPDVLSDNYNSHPNKVYEFRDIYRTWLEKVYEICTELETVRLGYGQVSMSIKRYSAAGRPFGYYEINPCEQLTKSAMLLQETDFYTLNTATLLMEMAAEFALRQEELNYYAKWLRLRSMEAATTDSIDFAIWEEKKLQKKVEEYIGKEYPLRKIFDQALRPWKTAVKKYFDAAAEQTGNTLVKTFSGFDSSSTRCHGFIENEFCPYLDKEGMEKAGLEDVEVVILDHWNMIIKSQGAACKVSGVQGGVIIIPNIHYESCSIELSRQTPLSAIAEYLRMMPDINRQIDGAVIQVVQTYDRRVTQKEVCQDDLVYLETQMKQYAGKPVGKLVKYIRWNLEGINDRRYSIPLQSVKIKGDHAFSFLLKQTVGFAVSTSGPNKLNPVIEDKVVDRWLDEECHHLYPSDPCAEGAQNKKETGAILSKRTSWTIQEFASHYLHAEPVLSIEFIDQKL